MHGHVLERAEVDELDAEREVLELGGAVTHGQYLVAKLLGLREHEVATVGRCVGVDQEERIPWDPVEPEVCGHVVAQRDEEGVRWEQVRARVAPCAVPVQQGRDGCSVL